MANAVYQYKARLPELSSETPKCPTIVHLGETDAEIPLEAMRSIAEQRATVQLYIYPAGHGFNSDRRADYHHDSAMLARERTLALFASQTVSD